MTDKQERIALLHTIFGQGLRGNLFNPPTIAETLQKERRVLQKELEAKYRKAK